MSFIILGQSKGETFILDTEDLVTDSFSDVELKKAKDLGVELLPASKASLNVGITSENNTYQVFVNGCDIPIYCGEFPTTSKRNELFEFEIKLADFGIIGNKLVIAIIANCWCKYDIEVPMVMCHVLYAPIRDVKYVSYACKTDEPVYFSTADILNKQYNSCMGDFPDKALDPSLSEVSISNDSLKVFGVDYGSSVPICDSLDSKLKFTVVRDI